MTIAKGNTNLWNEVICPKCSLIYGTWDEFENHMILTCVQPYKCNICGTACISEAAKKEFT